MKRNKHSNPVEYVDILFVENKEKPPCTMEFVEVENEYGESVSFGEWIDEGCYTRLRISLVENARLKALNHKLVEALKEIKELREGIVSIREEVQEE